MTHEHLKSFIESAYEHAGEISPKTKGVVRDAVEETLDLLDKGEARVAEKIDGDWVVHQWLKKAILLSFRLNDPHKVDGGPAGGAWWDKVPTKFANWKAKDFKEAGFRAVPGAIVRRSAYIAPGVVLMPSFVNLGARVDSGTMVDTWATVGLLRADRQERASLRRRRHRRRARAAASEPGDHRGQLLHRRPRRGRRGRDRRRRLGACRWASISASRPRSSTAPPAKCMQGRVPPYSVVVSGTMPGKLLPNGAPGPSLYCAVIVKTVDEGTRAKTSINELLRD